LASSFYDAISVHPNAAADNRRLFFFLDFLITPLAKCELFAVAARPLLLVPSVVCFFRKWIVLIVQSGLS